jgi:predicted Fe-Mo cluster-binding NifX family protein
VAGLAPDIIITGNGPGGNAASALAATGVKLYTGAGDMKVEEAYNAWKNNLLKEFKF